ncbi:hypothetical protein ACVIGA_005718 [Bradyrhizobium sp. USDA 3240]
MQIADSESRMGRRTLMTSPRGFACSIPTSRIQDIDMDGVVRIERPGVAPNINQASAPYP